MDTTDQDITYIRLLITDTSDDPNKQIFDDDEIIAVAAHERSAKRAAARLLDAMAVSEILVAKKIRTQDLQTDGPAVAAELRSLAAELRQEDAEDWNDTYPAVVVEPYRPNPPMWCAPELCEPDLSGWPF